MTPTTETIWLKYHKELQGFIRSKIKDADLTKDIIQEVFIKIHTHIHTINDPEKVRQWVYQITRNAIIDHLRSQKLFMNTNEFELKDEPSVINNNHPFVSCLSSFVKRLPLKYKEAITKVEIGQMSQHEFAKQLRISYSGAKSRVQRAKQLLRSYFIQCCNVSTDKYGNVVEIKGKSNCGICEL